MARSYGNGNGNGSSGEANPASGFFPPPEGVEEEVVMSGGAVQMGRPMSCPMSRRTGRTMGRRSRGFSEGGGESNPASGFFPPPEGVEDELVMSGGAVQMGRPMSCPMSRRTGRSMGRRSRGFSEGGGESNPASGFFPPPEGVEGEVVMSGGAVQMGRSSGVMRRSREMARPPAGRSQSRPSPVGRALDDPRVGIAQLGVSAITAIADNSGDISWDLRGMEGYYHPQHDFWAEDVRRQQGTSGWRAPWTFDVFCKMETVAGDEMSARIPVSFQGNGTYIANVEVGHPSNLNDAWLWDLHITGVATRDSQTHARGNSTEAASVKLEFTYHFSSPIHDSKICKLTYWLYANGDVVRSVRWSQP